MFGNLALISLNKVIMNKAKLAIGISLVHVWFFNKIWCKKRCFILIYTNWLIGSRCPDNQNTGKISFSAMKVIKMIKDSLLSLPMKFAGSVNSVRRQSLDGFMGSEISFFFTSGFLVGEACVDFSPPFLRVFHPISTLYKATCRAIWFCQDCGYTRKYWAVVLLLKYFLHSWLAFEIPWNT